MWALYVSEGHPRYLSGSLFDTADEKVLARNVQLVAEALARYMFDLSNNGLVGSGRVVHRQIFTNADGGLDEFSYLKPLDGRDDDDSSATRCFLEEGRRVGEGSGSGDATKCQPNRVIDTEVDLKEEIKVFGDNEVGFWETIDE